jgi:hypothetical protein
VIEPFHLIGVESEAQALAIKRRILTKILKRKNELKERQAR